MTAAQRYKTLKNFMKIAKNYLEFCAKQKKHLKFIAYAWL